MARPATARIALALSALAAAALLVPGLGVGALYLAPALLLALPLLLRRYVGEERIARLARAFAPRRPRRAVVRLAPTSRAPRALVPRSGRLLACSLASRPPPAPVCC